MDMIAILLNDAEPFEKIVNTLAEGPCETGKKTVQAVLEMKTFKITQFYTCI